MSQFSDVATINQTLVRAKAEGLGIPETALRRWINEGSIPSVRVGIKFLIYYPNVLAFLRGESITRPASGE